jgi:hypothetical protein
MTAAIQQVEAAGGVHLVPILEAVRDHGVGLLLLHQGRVRFRLPEDAPPFITICSDDPSAPTKARGPAAFASASLRRLIKVAHCSVIVASAPAVEIYATAAVAAGLFGRNVLLVETTVSQELAWARFIQATAPRLPLMIATVKGGPA